MFNVELLTQLCHLQEDRACVYFPPRSQQHCGSQKVLNKYLLNKINYRFEIALSNLKIITFPVYQNIFYHIICKKKTFFLGEKNPLLLTR